MILVDQVAMCGAVEAQDHFELMQLHVHQIVGICCALMESLNLLG